MIARIRMLCILALIAGIAFMTSGCGSVELRSSSRIFATTRISDANGTPLKDFCLRPGDVLYIRRWSAGVRSEWNQSSPMSSEDRLPLRLVARDGFLHDEEREFLLNFLNTNRAYSQPPPAKLDEAIIKNEAQMWNNLVTTLCVINQGKGIKAVANLRKVKEPLENTEFVNFFKNYDNAEISGIDEPFSDPAAAMVQDFGTKKNPKFYTKTNDMSGHLYNFVSVQKDGLELQKASSAESHWSLQELQESGIYSDKPTIDAITVPGVIRKIWFNKILPESDDTTFELKQILIDGQYSRSLQPKRKWIWNAGIVLSASTLNDFTVMDVATIVWKIRDDQLVECRPGFNPYEGCP